MRHTPDFFVRSSRFPSFVVDHHVVDFRIRLVKSFFPFHMSKKYHIRWFRSPSSCDVARILHIYPIVSE